MRLLFSKFQSSFIRNAFEPFPLSRRRHRQQRRPDPIYQGHFQSHSITLHSSGLSKYAHIAWMRSKEMDRRQVGSIMAIWMNILRAFAFDKSIIPHLRSTKTEQNDTHCTMTDPIMFLHIFMLMLINNLITVHLISMRSGWSAQQSSNSNWDLSDAPPMPFWFTSMDHAIQLWCIITVRTFPY